MMKTALPEQFEVLGERFDATGHFVDIATIGQYTGLRDKNGKKIFEGDMVSIRFEDDAEPPSTPNVCYETAEVFFSNEFLVWECRFADGLVIHFAEYNDCDIFVIGNIHDNPELLEVYNG